MALKRVTKDVELEIVKACREGMTGQAIAEQLGLTGSWVSKILKRNGLRLSRECTPEQQEIVLSALHSGKSGREAAALSGMSPSAVSNIVRRHDIKTKKGRRPSCEIDHTVFDTITPESAYWIGFLFADGCITDGGGAGAPQLMLGLASKDRGHVEKFRAFCKSTHAIIDKTYDSCLPGASTPTVRYSSSFSVRSQKYADALRRWGMIAKKGVLRCPSKEIENSADFWRGCIDGDGTVRVVKDHKGHDYRYASLILCGHMPLLESYQAFLMRHNTFANITDTSSGIFQIRLMGSGAYGMIKLLYENASVALDRKAASAKEVLEQARPRK